MFPRDSGDVLGSDPYCTGSRFTGFKDFKDFKDFPPGPKTARAETIKINTDALKVGDIHARQCCISLENYSVFFAL